MKKDHQINPVDLGDQRIDVEQAASAGMDLHGTRSRIKRRGVGFICSSLKHGKAECPLRGGTTSGKGPSTEPGDGGDAHGGKAGSKGSGKKDGPCATRRKIRRWPHVYFVDYQGRRLEWEQNCCATSDRCWGMA